jgi:hypothetical protein
MRPWRTVRVFLSSTFRDMHAERDHLVKVVFPALREELGEYRVNVVDVDLRWGVTAEQAENNQVLDLCLQEIDEARPFFIGILGERYGWVPTGYPADVGGKSGWIQEQTGKSVTELEILYGALKNEQMRGHAFFFFRDAACLESVPETTRFSVYADKDPRLIQKLADLKKRILSRGLPGHAELSCSMGSAVLGPRNKFSGPASRIERIRLARTRATLKRHPRGA